MLLKKFEYEGYPCEIIKLDKYGLDHLCGYVGLSKTHPYYGMSYFKIEPRDKPLVHGGITYSRGENPDTGKPDGYWWLGFDCVHVDDWVDYMADLGWKKTSESHEWTVDDVEEEIKNFIDKMGMILSGKR